MVSPNYLGYCPPVRCPQIVDYEGLLQIGAVWSVVSGVSANVGIFFNDSRTGEGGFGSPQEVFEV
jgi:hypothetical protein